MTTTGLFVPDAERRVIPRWRDSRVTAASGELDGLGRVRPVALNRSDLARALAAWGRDQSVESAAEVVSSAIVFGERRVASDAAAYLLGVSTVRRAVKVLAESVLSEEPRPIGEPLGDGAAGPATRHQVRAGVHRLKVLVRESPRNALAWVDLSRAYVVNGQYEQAKRSMEIALGLSRSNRFVLRSAARLFVHLREPDRAHDLLQRSSRTKNDPWLLAAEIATASVAERQSRFIKDARLLLGATSFRPRDTAELASAMATLELNAGQGRQARRLFRRSLTDPTENTVAQAEWATKRDNAIEVPAEVIRQAQSHEAQALVDYRAERWSGVTFECRQWLVDEPFSSRPAAWGSYLALMAENDALAAKEFAREGLISNPRHPLLLNNLVVALVDLDDLVAAREEFRRIPKSEVRGQLDAAILATEGLLRFRVGQLDEGRRLYHAAATMAADAGWRSAYALALVYLAREEKRIGSALASSTVEIAAKACQGLDSPEIKLMLRRLQGL